MPARSAVQRIRLVNVTGGTFTLAYEGSETSPLGFNASAAEAEAALVALPGIGAGNLSVSSVGEIGTGNSRKQYLARFGGDLAARAVGDITVDATALTGASKAVEVTRLAGYGPGGVYLGAGAGAGAKLLAFGPLAPPARATLAEPLSRVLAKARTVAVDPQGYVYAGDEAIVHVFGPDGKALASFEDAAHPARLAVDSTGTVYVLEGESFNKEPDLLHPLLLPAGRGDDLRPPRTAASDQPKLASLISIAIDPANDHPFVLRSSDVVELDSAAHGSAVLSPSFGASLATKAFSSPQDIGVDGATGDVYISQNPNNPISGNVSVLDPSGTELLAQLDGANGPLGTVGSNPLIAVDQSNGHVLTFEPGVGVAQEYDASGAFIAEFGQFPKIEQARADRDRQLRRSQRRPRLHRLRRREKSNPRPLGFWAAGLRERHRSNPKNSNSPSPRPAAAQAP